MTGKNVKITDLIDFAKKNGLTVKSQDEIASEAIDSITKKYNYGIEQIKLNFDRLLDETEQGGYRIYLEHEKEFGKSVFELFIKKLKDDGELNSLEETGKVLGGYFRLFDKFFLSLAQSRKSRAGKSFENFHNSLFKSLNYPFDYQKIINGKPDFLMPSVKHYRENPIDCIIFTAKRTLRERCRQIVTEGTSGLGFFLATIDDKVSDGQLKEMLDHRIYLVVPQRIKKENYKKSRNVLNFTQFFRDHLDPAMKRWKYNKVI